jgi:diguanylate cyclase (GGDEF)-like protein
MTSAGAIPAHFIRARRTAAFARVALAILAIATVATEPGLVARPESAMAGFLVMLVTATVQLTVLGWEWLKIEESFAGVSALLIIGLGTQRVTVVMMLWLAAVASGVLARGGRVHWVGRALVLLSVAGPIIREGALSLNYAAFVIAAIALLVTCGRVTHELQSLLDSAREDADHDSLTGALARTAFRAEVDRAASGASEGGGQSLLLISLDVSAINKASGQAARDAFLGSAFLKIKATIPGNAVLGRLGGGVFAALVAGTDPEALARRVLEELRRETSDTPAACAWIGVARIPEHGRDAETLLRASDVALTVARGTGPNQYSVYVGESLSEDGPGGALSALMRLIAGEGLTMHVQPIIDLRSGRPSAYEALARFQSRVDAGPLYWFALADEVGVRDELELACLREALKLLRDRPADTLLSINLSGPMLLDPRTHALLQAQPSVAGLILEVTENSLLEDTPRLHAAITKLRGAGIRIAVDDMGAGYSGLRQVTTVHPTYLKLDCSMIRDIDHDSDRGALVSALSGYAAQTGGYVVAEGVETAAELETLERLGVTLVQGYFLGRPAPPWPEVGAATHSSNVRVRSRAITAG